MLGKSNYLRAVSLAMRGETPQVYLAAAWVVMGQPERFIFRNAYPRLAAELDERHDTMGGYTKVELDDLTKRKRR